MAVVLYVDRNNGDNNNSGSSPGNSPKVFGGTATTIGTATVSLLGGPYNLSTVVAGDTIRINGRTDGRNGSDIFEITSVNDGADTVNVTPSPGAATNQGWVIGGAFGFIDRAMNVVAAGDKVWVKGNSTYPELVTIDIAATATAPIIFEGYTTTTGDGGRATITGSNSRNRCLADSTGGGTALYYVFKNFIFTASTDSGAATDGDYITFKNCQFTSNGDHGISCQLANFENCTFNSNSNAGCLITDGGCIFVGCKFYSNATDGLNHQTFSAIVVLCTFFSNAGKNMTGGGSGRLIAVINCTFDGDGKDSDVGLNLTSTAEILAVVNCIFYDCTTGMSHSGNMGERVISKNNLINSNTTAYSNSATFTGEVTSAPQFTNEVGGADYTPTTGSPLINAGLNG